MKKKLEVLNQLSAIGFDLEDYYSIGLMSNIRLQGECTKRLVRFLESRDFEMKFDKENLWMTGRQAIDGVFVEVTLTIKQA